MRTEKELMKLVADYGKECISAGIAELNSLDAVKQRMAEDVRTAHVALTDRLRALLAERDAAREDAARYGYLKKHHVRYWKSAIGGLDSVDFDFEANGSDIDAAIDAARKGEA